MARGGIGCQEGDGEKRAQRRVTAGCSEASQMGADRSRCQGGGFHSWGGSGSWPEVQVRNGGSCEVVGLQHTAKDPTVGIPFLLLPRPVSCSLCSPREKKLLALFLE